MQYCLRKADSQSNLICRIGYEASFCRRYFKLYILAYSEGLILSNFAIKIFELFSTSWATCSSEIMDSCLLPPSILMYIANSHPVTLGQLSVLSPSPQISDHPSCGRLFSSTSGATWASFPSRFSLAHKVVTDSYLSNGFYVCFAALYCFVVGVERHSFGDDEL